MATITVGAAELLYTDAQFPSGVFMDGPAATLKASDTEFYWWRTQSSDTYKFRGPTSAPFQTQVWAKTQGELWTMQGDTSIPWLYNVYRIDATHLLGFVHTEYGEQYYAIGLGYSSDAGDTWTWCGDIVRPYENIAREDDCGGVPYLVVGSYFYVYFTDRPVGGGSRVAVARALIADVLTAAASGTVTPWWKYNAGAWDQPGLSGLGSNVIPAFPGGNTSTNDTYNDAAYCPALGKYLLLISTNTLGHVYLCQSSDGVTWPLADAVLVDDTSDDANTAGWNAFFGTFAGLTGATEDCREVGSTFYVMVTRKKQYADFYHDQLYRHPITISGVAPQGTPVLSVE